MAIVAISQFNLFVFSFFLSFRFFNHTMIIVVNDCLLGTLIFWVAAYGQVGLDLVCRFLILLLAAQ